MWVAESNPGVVCQVPNCKEPFPFDNPFLKRCRICAYHAKLPTVVLEGRATRFCNLCKRLHVVEAFDGDKRSCREALEKHNARRRQRRSEDRVQREAAASLPNGFPPPPPHVFDTAIAGAPPPPGTVAGRWVWQWEGGGTGSRPSEVASAPGMTPAQQPQQRLPSAVRDGDPRGGSQHQGGDEVIRGQLHQGQPQLQPPQQQQQQMAPLRPCGEYVVQEVEGGGWAAAKNELDARFRFQEGQLLPPGRGADGSARTWQAGHPAEAQQAQQQGPSQPVQSYGHALQAQLGVGAPPVHPRRKRSVESASQPASRAILPRFAASLGDSGSPALAAPVPPIQRQRGLGEQPFEQHQHHHQVLQGQVAGGADIGASSPHPARQLGGGRGHAVDLRGLNHQRMLSLFQPDQGRPGRGPGWAELQQQGGVRGLGPDPQVVPHTSSRQRQQQWTAERGPGWGLDDFNNALNNAPPSTQGLLSTGSNTSFHHHHQRQHHHQQHHSLPPHISPTVSSWAPQPHPSPNPLPPPQALRSLHHPNAPHHQQEAQQEPTSPCAPHAPPLLPVSYSAAQREGRESESRGPLLPMELENLSMALSELELEAVMKGGEGSLRTNFELSQMLSSTELKDLMFWIPQQDSLRMTDSSPAQGQAEPLATSGMPFSTRPDSVEREGLGDGGAGGEAQCWEQSDQSADASQHTQQALRVPTWRTGVPRAAVRPPTSAPPTTPSHAQEARHDPHVFSQRGLHNGCHRPHLQLFPPQGAPQHPQRPLQCQDEVWDLLLQQAREAVLPPVSSSSSHTPSQPRPQMLQAQHGKAPAAVPWLGPWEAQQQGGESSGCDIRTSSEGSRGGLEVRRVSFAEEGSRGGRGVPRSPLLPPQLGLREEL